MPTLTLPNSAVLTETAAAQTPAQQEPKAFHLWESKHLKATLREVVTEPMFGLLVVAGILYVVLGQLTEALVLAVALLLVAGISVYQTRRSDQALAALRRLTQPRAWVWRERHLIAVPVEELVVGDVVVIMEGEQLPADGKVHDVHDFTVDEAPLTGEAAPVAKLVGDPVFAGTSVVSGSAELTITAVGERTMLGHLGRSLYAIAPPETPLQMQVKHFVWRMAGLGAAAFGLVFVLNFARTGDGVTALLFALTLAMSILPEEIPVALSSFMALGALRLSRLGVLTKQPQTVESIGSATVLCADKTGTLTQEGMKLKLLYDSKQDALVPLSGALSGTAQQVLAYARWASETIPFDPMEAALADAFSDNCPALAANSYPLIHEYPLDGTPPMMTHVRQSPTGELVVAGKGALEHLLAVCHPTASVAERVREVAQQLAAQGYRVLGVARGTYQPPGFPASQDDFTWTLLGLVALENPPKANAAQVVASFGQAGIGVKMITGDHPETAQAIARQIGLPKADTLLTGTQVLALDDAALQAQVARTAVFARMFPEAKRRVVQALRRNGEVVVMTGDGINDGPALKAAHIGVAMGWRGTEVARQAAALVLVNDDLSCLVEVVAQGRRIYQNLQKAVSYIVSVHLSILLTVAVPLLAAWPMANLLSPVHIIFLELIMGPTCSIAFENEPAEAGQMCQPPRPRTTSFLGGAALGRSLAQGLAIGIAVLAVYYGTMRQGSSLAEVRTLVFTTLVLSNITLTLVGRSFTQLVVQTIRVPNRLLWLMLGLTSGLLLTVLLVPAAQQLFGFAPLSAAAFGGCAVAALLGAGWLELYKLLRL